jgi:glycerophosphoryl diester phosphodiesterase
MTRISPLPILRVGWRNVKTAGLRLIGVAIALQLVMLLIASPLMSWLFSEALRANGMLALDLGSLQFTGGIGITLGLLFVIMLLALWLASVQFTILVQLLNRARTGQPSTLRTIGSDLARLMRKLLRPSALPLLGYLFFILPLSGFGFVSVLSQGIAVPSFISGELMKTPLSASVWVGFMLLIALLNLRFALSLPLFAMTSVTGGKSLRLSWRLTRGWAAVKLALAVIVVLLAAALASFALFLIAIIPTVISDEVMPQASPVVAAVSLGIAQVLGMALTAGVTGTLIAVLLALASERQPELAAAHTPQDHAAGAAAKAKKLPFVAAAVVLAIGLSVIHFGTMTSLAQHPQTLVIGHRGFSAGGAENTIGGLEAAAAAGADLAEIDVMQTADKRFVIMHDAHLTRLADMDVQVKDLTLEELTAITVRDQFGHEGKIPSLEEFMLRAKQLDLPLLIEIKLGGLDTPDFVDLLVAELDELDALENNIFHTLDPASVERLKTLRPNASVGYILAFAGVDIPDTVADFIVIEQWSATQEMQEAAAKKGLGFFSWTVNDEAGLRELLRREADGIITDHPDVALAARDEMHEETGLSGILIDALVRFVLVF